MRIYKSSEVIEMRFGLIPLRDYLAWIKYRQNQLIEKYKNDNEEMRALNDANMRFETIMRAFLIKCFFNASAYLNVGCDKVSITNVSMGSVIRNNDNVPFKYLLFNVDNNFSLILSEFELSSENKVTEIRFNNFDEDKIEFYINSALTLTEDIISDAYHECNICSDNNKDNVIPSGKLIDNVNPFEGINVKDFH